MRTLPARETMLTTHTKPEEHSSEHIYLITTKRLTVIPGVWGIIDPAQSDQGSVIVIFIVNKFIVVDYKINS